MTQYYAVPSTESIDGALVRSSSSPSLKKEEYAFDNEPFSCCASKKWFFTYFNGVAALFHLSLLLATVFVTCSSDAGCKGPAVHTYYTDLLYKEATQTSGMDLVPIYEKNPNPLYLVSLPIAFFSLSFLAHCIIMYLAGWTNVYRDWLLTCQQPIRWIEYSARKHTSLSGSNRCL